MRHFTAVALIVAVATTHGRADDVKTGLYEGAGHTFHIRLAVNATKKEVTATVLDGKAKEMVPIGRRPSN
jgi:hypothetical protein